MDTQKIEVAVKMIIEAVGEDANREGLQETPARVARMYQEIFFRSWSNSGGTFVKIL